MNITDTVSAHTLEDGDQAIVNLHHMEDIRVQDCGETITISGYSHEEGDRIHLTVPADQAIELWSI